MPDDDWALGSNTVDFRNEERRWAARHGGPVEEPPQDVFLSDDPALGMVHADMGAWLRAHATHRCPECGNEDLSYDGSAYAADRDERPDAPMVCENCDWHGTDEEARP